MNKVKHILTIGVVLIATLCLVNCTSQEGPSHADTFATHTIITPNGEILNCVFDQTRLDKYNMIIESEDGSTVASR